MAWCVGLSEVKTHFNRYAKKVWSTGESLCVLKRNKPYLKISPVDDADFLGIRLREREEIRGCETSQPRNRETPNGAQ